MRRQFSRSFQRNPGNDLVIMQRRVPADLMTKHRSRQQQNLAVDIEVRDGVLVQHVVGTLSPAFDIGSTAGSVVLDAPAYFLARFARVKEPSSP